MLMFSLGLCIIDVLVLLFLFLSTKVNPIQLPNSAMGWSVVCDCSILV